MNESIDRKSIIDMASGAIKERIEYEMAKVIDNILDINTSATKKRTLTLVIDITPDSERRTLSVKTIAKSKLEPTNPISTALYITGDENGEVCAVEMLPQIPGQLDVIGQEQAPPIILKFATNS